MTGVAMSARVRCKNKACGERVPLSAAHLRELSVALKASVTCPKCGTAFVTSLIPTVKERPAPPPDPPPAIVIPVPDGAKQAEPPFRPLPPAVPEAAVAPPPAAVPELVAAARRPAAEVLPFAPIGAGPPPAGGKTTGGVTGWWNRLSKRAQYAVLAAGLVLAAGFVGMVKLRGQPAPPVQRQEPAPPPAAPRPPEPESDRTPAEDDNPFNPSPRR